MAESEVKPNTTTKPVNPQKVDVTVVNADDTTISGQSMNGVGNDKRPGDLKSETLHASGQSSAGDSLIDTGLPLEPGAEAVSKSVDRLDEQNATNELVDDSVTSIEKDKAAVASDIDKDKSVEAEPKKEDEDSGTEDTDLTEIQGGEADIVGDVEGESKDDGKVIVEQAVDTVSDTKSAELVVSATKSESTDNSISSKQVSESSIISHTDISDEGVKVQSSQQQVTETTIEKKEDIKIEAAIAVTTSKEEEKETEKEKITVDEHNNIGEKTGTKKTEETKTSVNTEAVSKESEIDVLSEVGGTVTESRTLIKSDVSDVVFEKETESETQIKSIESEDIQKQKVLETATEVKTDFVVEEVVETKTEVSSTVLLSESELETQQEDVGKVKSVEDKSEVLQVNVGDKVEEISDISLLEAKQEKEDTIKTKEKSAVYEEATLESSKLEVDSSYSATTSEKAEKIEEYITDSKVVVTGSEPEQPEKLVDIPQEEEQVETMAAKPEIKQSDPTENGAELPPLNPLSDEEIDTILARHPMLSEEQKKRFLAFFWEVDQDRIGLFNIHQLTYWLRTHGWRMKDSDIAAMFVDLDQNNDMLVSLDEFLDDMSKKPRKPMTKDNIQEWFERFDKDQDGFVNRKDFRLASEELNVFILPTDFEDFMAFDSSGKAERLDYKDFELAFKRCSKM